MDGTSGSGEKRFRAVEQASVAASRAGRALVVALVCALLAAAPAGSQEPLRLAADTSTTGYVDLRLLAPPATPVTVSEMVGEEAFPVASLTTEAAETVLPRAAAWRCDRRTRRFVATTSDGRSATAEVRTPSCAARLGLRVASRARPGRALHVRVRDRWKLGGVTVSLCAHPPGGAARCTGHELGARPLKATVRVPRPGGWRISAVAPWRKEVRDVAVARRGGRLRLLVSGDSMIQPLDDFLRTRLRKRHVRVSSDPRISTGISKPSMLDWPAHARSQVGAVRPDVTVVLLGANDGFPIGDAPCCGDAWVEAYAQRARGMMKTYARAGRGRVYWLALPAPRGGYFRTSFPAVNAALRRAAKLAGADVRLIRLDRYFTPGWRYRDTMRIGGRTVRVRQDDGVHLSVGGASAAANLIIRALRRERIVR
jgi:lysophospholipase L1-like esterase